MRVCPRIAAHINRAHRPVRGEGYDAFDRWWGAQAARLSVDDTVRGYMHAVLEGANAPWYLRPAMPLQRFVTRGLMPPALRTLFGLPWTPRDARRWERFKRWAPRVYWHVPRVLRHWPAKYFLAQLD